MFKQFKEAARNVAKGVLFVASGIFGFVAPIWTGVAVGMVVHAAIVPSAPVLAVVLAIIVGWMAAMVVASLIYSVATFTVGLMRG